MPTDVDIFPRGPCAHCGYSGLLLPFYWAGRTFELCDPCFSVVRAGRLVLRRLEDLAPGEEGVSGLLQ
jgi:hypothetical protein